jgi:hypothetical protein
MKAFLIKYLYLSYTVVLFGVEKRIPRAPVVLMPLFCVAIAMSLWLDFGLIPWLLFSAGIMLTFPLVKNDYINKGSLIMCTGLVVASIFSPDIKWWEPLPFLYFSLGLLVKKTRFLFPVYYKDLQDWEQKYQYLLLPIPARINDKTTPVNFEELRALEKFKSWHEQKYEGEEFVNADKALLPVIAMVILLILAVVLGVENSGFPETRGF